MQKVIKSILSFCLVIAMCLSIALVANNVATELVVADAVTDYYSSLTSKSGNELLGEIHDLITTTHATYTTYANCRDYATKTDPALSGTGIVEFYTHETIKDYIYSTNSPGTWNREHVWPHSISNNLWGTSGG